MNGFKRMLSLIVAFALVMGMTGWTAPPSVHAQETEMAQPAVNSAPAPMAQSEKPRPEDIPEEITIYAMNDYYEEYLSIPEDFPQSWTFGGHTVEIKGGTGALLELEGDNTVIPEFRVMYYHYESGFWVGSTGPSGEPGEIVVQEYTFGDREIVIDGEWTVKVHLVNYASYYAEQVMIAYLEENVTDDMTQYEIAELCCQFVASYDYSPDAADYTGMILIGGGDCWASVSTLCFMLEHEGIKCDSRDASTAPDAGARHANVIAQLDGEYYILEAGYNAPAPRNYDITKYELSSLLLYEKHHSNGKTTAYITGVSFDTLVTDLVIPEQVDGITVTGIADSAFIGNENITSVILPDTIEYLGAKAFEYCLALERINLPEGLETIGDRCFYWCHALKELNLPSTLSKIEVSSVTFCYSLGAIHVHADNPFYGSIDGVLTNDAEDTILLFPAGKGDWPYSTPWENGSAQLKSPADLQSEYIIPDGITAIESYAFWGVSIGTVLFPEHIIDIGRGAFYHANIRELTLPEGMTIIDEITFSRCNFYKLTLPSTLKRIGDGAFHGGAIKTDLILPDGLEYIGEGAFAGNACIYVSVPASVKEIGAGAFDFDYGWSSMDSSSVSSGSRNFKGAIFLDRDCRPEMIAQSAFDTEVLCVYPDSYMHNYAVENGLLWHFREEDGTVRLQQDWIEGVGWILDYSTQLSPYYTGEPIIPELDWTDEDGVCPFEIREEHLDIRYSDPVNIGTCTITITGKGLLSGTISTEYSIYRADPEDDVIDRSGCGLQYQMYDDHVEIVGYIASALQETLVIPETIENLPVTKVAWQALYECPLLKEVVIPGSITDLGYESFCGCENLEYIWFTGDMPRYMGGAFDGGCAYYPAGNDTWDTGKLAGTGIDLWMPMCTAVGVHHAFEDTVVAPGCVEEGYNLHTCPNCGYSYRDCQTEATGHSYTASVTAPTCTEQGYTTYTCACGDNYTAEYTDPLGHAYGEWTVVSAPTCTAEGEERSYCANCDAFESRSIQKTEHIYEPTVTAPTCTEQGYTTYTCACGERYVDDYVDPLDHAWNAGEITKEPTEAQEGERTYTCERCGAEKVESIPRLEHTHHYTETVTAPTCTEQGYATYTCACGESYKDHYVDPLGHDWSEWNVIREATCMEPGEETRQCHRCGETETVYPTTGCQYTYEEFEATCEEPGYQLYTCVYCGDTYTNILSEALGHNYETTVIDPTCTEPGCTRTICSRCGDSHVSDEVPALGHDYLNGTCTRCGEPDASFVPENPFTDVPDDQWYHESVLWAVEEGITSGTAPDTFSPEKTCTRAQVVTFLWRAMGQPEPRLMVNPFTDVKEEDYYYSAVLWALEQGVTAGTSQTTFSPDAPCTRAQVVTFLWRAMGQPTPETVEHPFTDVPEGIWFVKPVLWAVERGVTAGVSATLFAPDNPCTRAQVVTFLYRTLSE